MRHLLLAGSRTAAGARAAGSRRTGRIPERYQLTETEEASYPVRTERNVRDGDGTVILTLGDLGGGSALTADFARRHRKPWLHLRLDEMEDAAAVARLRDFIREHGIRTLNVAGSRASTEPGIYGRCRVIVTAVVEAVHHPHIAE